MYRMDENTDNILIEKAKQGDTAAIAELFSRYWRAARATAFGILANIDLAEDAASEALFNAFKNIGDLRDASKFGPWLHTIVIRSAQHLKESKPSKNDVNLKQYLERDNTTNFSELEQRELASLIREAVANLPDILREAISLFYFEGYNIEQIADFLDVPAGTVKRRLHDGRRALRDSAQKIIEGTKPMNNKRQQILRQLNDFLETGGDSDTFNKVMRMAMKLRPLPYELLGKIMSKHSPVAKRLKEPQERRKYELRAKQAMEIFSKPSPRVTDSNHPVGIVVNALKSALPEFKERKVDTDKLAQNIIQLHTTGQVNSSHLPSGFDKGIPGSFISLSKGGLFRMKDGSLCTMNERMLKKENDPEGDETILKNGYICNILHLLWLRKDNIELRSIEELLRRLSKQIAPEIKFIFTPYEEPSYSSALRMQFVDIAGPAAIGGIYFAWPGLPDGVSVASVQLFLEAWATAQSSQTIELDKNATFLKMIHDTKNDQSQDDTE